ncbi:MAG: hypothetical protein P8Z49_09985, partial [Acidobacteriota bacterium]
MSGRSKRCLTVFLAGILVCGALAVPAAENGKGTPLSLQDAINLALKRNFDIKTQKITYEESYNSLEASKGIYDPLLQAGITSQVQ